MAIEFPDLQGNVMPGFAKPKQVFLFFELRRSHDWLVKLCRSVTSQKDVLQFRAELRVWRQEQVGSRPTSTWLNIGLTSSGLQKLGQDPSLLRSGAFTSGLAARAHITDGPTQPGDPANPNSWLVGGAGTAADVLLHLGCDDQSDLIQAMRQIVGDIGDAARLIHYDIGSALEGPLAGKEHFGYKDGISQPKSIGTPTPGTITDVIAPDELFAFSEHGKTRVTFPTWASDGTFAVYERLAQDVGAFRRVCTSTAEALTRRYGTRVSPSAIGARIFGRWTSGAPLSLSPNADDPALGRDDERNNLFGYQDDPMGVKCPIDSHVRLALRRDDAIGKGQPRRILRRGIPFGAPYPLPGDRGLLFLSFQASIEQQFEELLGPDETPWEQISTAATPLFGLNERPFNFSFARDSGGFQEVSVRIKDRFVVTTGGAYLFYPTISGLRALLEADHHARHRRVKDQRRKEYRAQNS
ncbi:Dyp-type peroxidase [Methylocystis sp.]|uniref:Dyp-type peroxidase n=1 Tax=Methylocystis sp. TaxID=1911079 RepID=UPI003DA4FAF4